MACSTRSPSGNQVDGLPLAASTHAVVFSAAFARNISGGDGWLSLTFSVALYQIIVPISHALDIDIILVYAKLRVRPIT